MNIVAMLVWILVPICILGYGFHALRRDGSSIIGFLLLAIGLSIFASSFEMWVSEHYHLAIFSGAPGFIFPVVVYCLPFIPLESRGVKYSQIIGPFLVGIPIVIGCGLVVGVGVACAMGDCL